MPLAFAIALRLCRSSLAREPRLEKRARHSLPPEVCILERLAYAALTSFQRIAQPCHASIKEPHSSGYHAKVVARMQLDTCVWTDPLGRESNRRYNIDAASTGSGTGSPAMLRASDDQDRQLQGRPRC